MPVVIGRNFQWTISPEKPSMKWIMESRLSVPEAAQG
jgi:hypothetical protein